MCTCLLKKSTLNDMGLENKRLGLVTLWTDFTIAASSSTSHFSTWPLAADVEIVSMSSTISPSLLFMCVISNASVNSTRAIPSKHFFKWGCTLENKTSIIQLLTILSCQQYQRKKKTFFWKVYLKVPLRFVKKKPTTLSFVLHPARYLPLYF